LMEECDDDLDREYTMKLTNHLYSNCSLPLCKPC
jgi:hypothetical protein